MLAFRSEPHVDRWCDELGLQKGAAFDLGTMWRLADAWYRDRLSADWRRRTADEAQALLEEVGLTGDFWRLT